MRNFRNNSHPFFSCSVLLKADAVHPSSSKELGKRQVEVALQIIKESP